MKLKYKGGMKMGKIKNGYIMPHPPIIIPEVGKGSEVDAAVTIEGVKKIAKNIAKDNPYTIILSSPHAPCFKDYVYISDKERLVGDLSSFGCPSEKFEYENNLGLASEILERAEDAGISAGGLTQSQKWLYGISDMLDHGAMVPLYFINKEIKNFKLIVISTPFLSLKEIYKFGECIKGAVEASNEDVVFVASGDLSHKLTKDAPAGFSSKGALYDQKIVEGIKELDIDSIINMEEDFMEEAGQCGTRSFLMMLGALKGLKLDSEIYSYEGPFGVGYLAAKIKVAEAEESSEVKLARETLETFIRQGRKLIISKDIPKEMLSKKAGVFVSLKKHGRLRGCIGTIFPTKACIAEEIASNAIKSGTEDPRFDPVREEELPELEYSVDVLGEPEKIDSIKELDVKKYGVIVTSGYRRGVLLPALEGVDTPEQQVDIALSKAGIGSNENYEMERFEVIRYK